MIQETIVAAAEFEPIEVGQSVTVTQRFTTRMVEAFAELSGDVNPLHMSDEFAQSVGFTGRVVHGALLVAVVSRLLGTVLPGPGCLWTTQSLHWRQPTYVGDEITVHAKVKHKSIGTRTLLLEIEVRNQTGKLVLNGEGAVRMLKPRGGEKDGNA